MTSASPDSEVFVVGVVDHAVVAARVAAAKARVLARVPAARVEHVGSTALRGMLTKGDIDLQVVVDAADFAAADAALGDDFLRKSDAYLSPTGQSFDDVSGEAGVPLSIHLTVKGSDSDEQWVFRELLAADAGLRSRYESIKQRHNGGPMERYRAEKSAFFSTLKAEPRFRATRALHGHALPVPLTVQWGEMDAYEHVNNIVYFRWFESARMALFHHVDFYSNRGVGPILHTTSCRYKAPVTFPDVVFAASRVDRVDDDRFLLTHSLYSDAMGRVAATGEALVVAYDHAAKKKAALPPPVRERLLALVVP